MTGERGVRDRRHKCANRTSILFATMGIALTIVVLVRDARAELPRRVLFATSDGLEFDYSVFQELPTQFRTDWAVHNQNAYSVKVAFDVVFASCGKVSSSASLKPFERRGGQWAGNFTYACGGKAPPPQPAISNVTVTKIWYILKDGLNSPSADLAKQLAALGEAYFQATGQLIVITDLGRTPEQQASAMYAKMAGGEDLFKLYKQTTLVKEILASFRAHKSEGKDKVIAEMAKTILAQTQHNQFVSRHLRRRAADVRIEGDGAADARALATAVSAVGGSLLDERGACTPHMHVNFADDQAPAQLMLP